MATASFETLAVPIIGDRFMNSRPGALAWALLVFNLSPPLGTGFSYSVAVACKSLFPGDWRYSMRFTPILLAILLVVIIFAYIEPERRKKKAVESSVNNETVKREYKKDVLTLMRNRSYLLLMFSWLFCLSALGKCFN